ASKVIGRMLTREFMDRFGLYLSGINRRHVMTISTGVATVSLARYHRVNEALGLIHQIASTRNLRTPGAPSEMSPDYGCFVQAWTGYAVAYPLVRQFFGITPRAHQRRVILAPHLPDSWQSAKLSRVRVADQHLNLAIEVDRIGGRVNVDVGGLSPDWSVEVH